jgi:hypothetical protein
VSSLHLSQRTYFVNKGQTLLSLLHRAFP